MKRKYTLLILGLTMSIISTSMSVAKGLNYTPGVKLGDELIYKIDEEFEGETDTVYKKYNISDIYDSLGETYVEAKYSSSENGIDFIYHNNLTIGRLGDYTENSLDLMDYVIIIPGTKIGSYKEEILFILGSNYEVRSIASGYGFKIKWDENWYTIEFNKDGIMEKTESVMDGNTFLSVLHSINGENYRFIPGFPIYVLCVSSLIGLLGVIFNTRNNMKN